MNEECVVCGGCGTGLDGAYALEGGSGSFHSDDGYGGGGSSTAIEKYVQGMGSGNVNPAKKVSFLSEDGESRSSNDTMVMAKRLQSSDTVISSQDDCYAGILSEFQEARKYKCELAQVPEQEPPGSWHERETKRRSRSQSATRRATVSGGSSVVSGRAMNRYSDGDDAKRRSRSSSERRHGHHHHPQHAQHRSSRARSSSRSSHRDSHRNHYHRKSSLNDLSQFSEGGRNNYAATSGRSSRHDRRGGMRDRRLSSSCSQLPHTSLPLDPPAADEHDVRTGNRKKRDKIHRDHPSSSSSLNHKDSQKQHGSSDSILAMAKRLDDASLVSDPDCIVGPDDPNYWKELRGTSKAGAKPRRTMSGLGNSIKKTDENGNASDAESNKRSRHGKHGTRSNRERSRSRNRRKQKEEASEKRRLHMEKIKKERREAKEKEKANEKEKVFSITNGKDGPSRSRSRSVDKQGKRSGNNEKNSAHGTSHQKLEQQQKQHQSKQQPQKQQPNPTAKILDRILGRKQDFRNSTGTTNSNLTGMDGSVLSMHSSAASATASDTRSMQSGRSGRSNRSRGSNHSKRSNKSTNSMRSISSKKSTASRFSMKLPFTFGKSGSTRQDATNSFQRKRRVSISKVPVNHLPKNTTSEDEPSTNETARPFHGSMSDLFAEQSQNPNAGRGHPSFKRSFTGTSVGSNMTPASASSAAVSLLYEQKRAMAQDPNLFHPSTVAFDDASSCDSSVSMGSSGRSALDFDHDSQSRCSHSEADDCRSRGSIRRTATVAQAVNYFNNQNKMTKVATGIRQRFRSSFISTDSAVRR